MRDTKAYPHSFDLLLAMLLILLALSNTRWNIWHVKLSEIMYLLKTRPHYSSSMENSAVDFFKKNSLYEFDFLFNF